MSSGLTGYSQNPTYNQSVEQKPEPTIRAAIDGCLEAQMSIRGRLASLLERLRPSPPSPVGEGKTGVEVKPAMDTVVHRISNTQRDCLEMLNEIESFI